MQWTEEKLALLRTWYGKLSLEALASRIGTRPDAVKLKASRLGIAKKQKKSKFVWTDKAMEVVKQRYETDEIAILSKELGASISSIRSKAMSLGLHSNVGRARAGRERAERNSSVDMHYFDKWSSNMAYIFGFLLADGSISKRGGDVVVGLAAQDEGLLHFIKKEMKSTRSIYRTEPKIDKNGYKHQSTCYLYLSSQLLVKKLQELGLQKRKTYTDEPFPYVPDAFFPDFVRGYLDGDGTIFVGSDKICRIRFIGSPRFIIGLRDSLVHLTGMICCSIKSGLHDSICARIGWSALEDLKRFYAFVYPPGHGFCLERKRDKLASWLASKGCL